MSFSLPQEGISVPLGRKKELFVVKAQQSNEIVNSLSTQERSEPAHLIKKQQDSIQVPRKSIEAAVESDDRFCCAQLVEKKQELEKELAKLTARLNDISGRHRELRQVSNHGIQCGEIRTILSKTISRTSDLKAEIQETERQLEAIRTFTSHRRERLDTVQRELQQARQQVKWMLECQAVDERAFKNRVREEEDYLQQLLGARDTTKKECSQLVQEEGFEITPLHEDVNMLEAYLDEMRGRTKTLQSNIQELHHEVEKAKRIAIESSSGKELLSLTYQRALGDVDQELICALNEQLQVAQQKSVLPLSARANKEQWLRNYLAIWKQIYKQCTRVLEEKKRNVGSALKEEMERIEAAQQKLDKIVDGSCGDAKEKEAAVLVIENLVYLLRTQQKREEKFIQTLKEAARGVGESPEGYVSIVKASGYEDIIDDDDEEGFLMPREPSEQLFKAISEESPEEDVDKMQSVVEIPHDDMKGDDIMRQTAHRSRGSLSDFLQQKSFFMSEQATRAHLSLRRSLPRGLPGSVEESVSHFQEKLLNGVVSFVRGRKKAAQGQIDLLHESLPADPHYALEAHEMQTKVQQMLSECRNVF